MHVCLDVFLDELISVWKSTCHAMVIYMSQRFSIMLCFFHFFLSFKYDFYVDAEKMIVKMREI